MRRVLLLLVIVSIASASVLHTWCEMSCGSPRESSATSCHHESATDLAMSAAHDCAGHAQVPALVPATSPAHQPLILAATSIDVGIDAARAPVRLGALAFRPPDSSPPSLIAPLRL